MSGCTEKCWTPVRCEHDREMSPRGRSEPLERPSFCDCYEDYRKNPRHLWDVHDDSRFYSDPQGWAMHLAACGQCRGDDE